MKKLALASLLAILLPSLVFAQVPNQSASTSDLQKQIQDLLKQIQVLQQQVSTLQAELGKEPEKTAPTGLPAVAGETPISVPAPAPESVVLSKPESIPPELTRTLSRGSSGDDVRKLQEFLSQDKDIYPAGLITGFFGPATESAVKRWQKKHNIESVGIMGPKSIAKLKDLGTNRVQQLIEEGAGASGITPPGLLYAPGVQKKIETLAVTASSTATTTFAATTTEPIAATTTTAVTTTPSGTISAVPAIPAVPATPAQPTSQTGTTTVPAVPTTSATTITTPTPPVPLTVTITSITPYSPLAPDSHLISSIHLQWNTTASTLNYKKTWRKFGNGDWMLVGIGQPNEFNDLNIGAGTYSYKVNACSSGSYLAPYDCGPDSNIMTTTLTMGSGSDTTPPSTPTGLRVWVDSYNRNFLSWTLSTDNVGVVGYNVYRNGAYLKSVCCAPAEDGFLFSSLVPFNYTVAAYDAAGNNSTQSASAALSSSSSDTTPPVLSGIQAINITATSTVIAWTTDEASDSQVEYGLTTSYGSQTALDAGSAANHSVIITGLTASTLYHYRVKSKDAAGNQAVSADQTFTTVGTPASLPVPLSMHWNWFGRITLPATTQNYQLIIYYPLSAIDAPASFNIYLKKPGESAFTKTNYPKSSLTKYVASSGSEASYSAYPLGNYGVPSDSIPLGEYNVYATAVDSAGIETAPTPTATGNYNLAPLIVNPANGSTQPSLAQVDLSNRSSLANPRYTVSLHGANGYIWAPNAFYGSSVTYNGPVLSSANNPHTLVAGIFPSGIDPADSSPYTVNTFNIASAATTTSSLDPRAKSIAAISRALDSIQDKLIKLLQGL